MTNVQHDVSVILNICVFVGKTLKWWQIEIYKKYKAFEKKTLKRHNTYCLWDLKRLTFNNAKHSGRLLAFKMQQ